MTLAILRRGLRFLAGALLVLGLTACPHSGAVMENTRTLSGQFSGGTTTQSMQGAATAMQEAVRTQSFRDALAAQGFSPQALKPLAGLWAPVVETELWSQGDTVVASRADGGAGVTATLGVDGSFTLALQLNVVYSLQLVRNGNFIAYLSNSDGTPINIRVTAAGASIDLGSISVVNGKFVVGNDPDAFSGVTDQGSPADYDERLADFVTVETTLVPTGISASSLYEGAVFLALDSHNVMVGAGIAPDGALTLAVPSEELAATVVNLATFDEAFLGDVTDFPPNTATYAIQVPYFEVDQDFSTAFPVSIDDGVWGLVEATVVDEFGAPIRDALLGAVSVAVGSGEAAPSVMVINVGRSDAQGRVQFYLLRNLQSDDQPGERYTYSLVASDDLSADFAPLYMSNGDPALITPAAGSGWENRFEITLGATGDPIDPQDPEFPGTWSMYSNNVGYYGDLVLFDDGTYDWDGDVGTWSVSAGSVYLNDGWGDNWRLDYFEDDLGPSFDIYTYVVSDWTHWGFAYKE